MTAEIAVLHEPETEAPEPLSPYQRAQRLLQAEVALDGRLLELGSELTEAQADSGAETLESVLAGEPASVRGTMRTAGAASQLHSVYVAIHEARRQRRAAITESYSIQGKELRAQAAALVRQASERQRKLDRLKTELESFEGVEYVIRQTREQSNRPLTIGKTAAIRAEAATLVARAEHLEARRAVDSGELVLAKAITIEELLAHFSNCVAIGPARHTLRSWLAETQAAPDPGVPRGNQLLPGENLTGIVLVWRDGEIVTAESGKRFAPRQPMYA